ncbi:MAG TPA: hypothetical protein VG323_20260 [Thermoanaerobaculia bacterium]|nr:hypothetical protein [Thermoanaerobaculia bacterium]
MIKIVCTSCQKPLSLDETKLPMKEVSFPCPVCKTKLTVDRRNMEMGAAAAPPQPAAPVTPGTPDETHDDTECFGEKTLIVGADHPALRQAAKLIGCIPVHMPTAQQAREFFVQEYPPVVMLNPAQVTAPPLESMQPIVSLTPADRRKAFFILFADNLRTLDGNAAFLYGVNLVVAFKDLGAFQQIYREALAYHERLYAPMTSVAKALAV